jgi:2-amino-4-hydroxy-6-hydroxymethyldihydropteridine diphosphokinase/dihydropteroate synthase
MLLLGLGSNLGDRLEHLRTAIYQLKQLSWLTIQKISPIYLSDALLPTDAPTEWNIPYLNMALSCETNATPEQVLVAIKEIERKMGRRDQKVHWGPRVIDIDILAYDDLVINTPELVIPHVGLQERPFALWPLADIAPFWTYPSPGLHQGKTAAEIVEPWGSRFTGNTLFGTKQILQRIEAPQLVGIINVTPDSFSDGGEFLKSENAIQQAMRLVQNGAEIIDIGAESTAPHAKAIDAETEWKRLAPILISIKEIQNTFSIPPKISIDTRHVLTAERALAIGVDWINDVSGLDDPAMRQLIAAAKIDCVVMHHLSLPERRDHLLPRNQDPTALVYEWGNRRLDELERDGVAREKVIFDPGIGFGKVAEQSLALLKNVEVFKSLGTRLLIGHSRKTFLSLLTGLPFAERDLETAVMSIPLAKMRVDYLRIHHVEMLSRTLRTVAALE